MDLLSKDSKKIIDACAYRVNAGFDVMRFTKDNSEMFEHIEHKQIDTIFGLLGKCLDYDVYSKAEKQKMVQDAIKRFDKERGRLPIKDFLRFMHLAVKAKWCLR